MAFALLCTLLLVLFGCQISPRLIVTSVGPSPTPSPTETPTPGITPTPTPVPSPVPTPVFPTPTPTPAGLATPTPTPMSMAGDVGKKSPSTQFLFAASPDTRLMNGFRINSDGSLAPVPGSPFVTRTPLRSLASLENALIAAGEDTVFAFAIDSETGTIRQTDRVKTASITGLTASPSAKAVIVTTSVGNVTFRLSQGKLEALPEEMTAAAAASIKSQSPSSAVLDSSGRFMYMVDTGKAELQAFQVDHGKPAALSPHAYPVSRGTAAIALVKR
ncbi:MAG TPA: hypothetical protein VIB39_00305 [Candidatus Angelobacter sp.]